MTGLLIEKIASLGILFVLGWILGRRAILSREATSGLARLIIDFTMPALFFTGALTLDMNRLELFWPLVPGGMAVCLTGLVLARLFVRQAAPHQPKRGVFQFVVSMGNSTFLPVPLCWALWGADGVLACMFYVLGNNFVMFTFGIGNLARAGGRPFDWRLARVTVFHPQTVAFLLGLLAARMGLTFPEWVLEPVDSFGDATLPLAMVATGAILAEIHLGRDVDWRMQSWVIALKLFALPAVALVVLKAWDPGALVAGVILLQAAMPSLASSGIYAKRFGGDAGQGSAAALITTSLCPLILPLWMSLL